MKVNKRIIYLTAVLFGTSLFHVAPIWAVPKGKIKLIVVGIKKRSGVLRIGLNNSKKAYESRGKIPAFKSGKVKVKKNYAEYTFKNVPYGEYTIKLYHDANNNDKLDTNVMGIPKEDYGISNNPNAKLGLPRYKKAKFKLKSKKKTLKIKLI